MTCSLNNFVKSPVICCSALHADRLRDLRNEVSRLVVVIHRDSDRVNSVPARRHTVHLADARLRCTNVGRPSCIQSSGPNAFDSPEMGIGSVSPDVVICKGLYFCLFGRS